MSLAEAADTPTPARIGPDQPLILTFDLESGTLLQVVVRQLDVDVTLKLVGPGGRRALEIDDRPTTEGSEELWYLARRGGEYRVEIASRWGESGTVRVDAREHRPGSVRERRRGEIEAIYRRARRARRRPGADRERAVRSLRQIRGELEALGFWRKAVDSAIEESILLQRLGRTRESVRLLEETLASSRARGDPLGRSRALNSLGVRRYQEGDLRGAVSRVREALRAAEEVEDPLVRAKIRLNLALFLSFAGENRQALEHYRIGGNLAARIGWLDGEATAWFNASLAHSGLRDYRAAFEHLRRADRLFARVGKPVDQGRMRMNEGVHLLNLGEPERAAERFRQALAVLPVGEIIERARALQNLGAAALRLGDVSTARIHTERCLDVVRRGEGHPKLEGTALQILSRIDLRQGRLEEGIRHARRAVKIARSSGVGRILTASLVSLGEAARRNGDLATAERTLSEALDVGTRNHDPEVVASAHLSRARLERDRGGLHRALEEIEAGIEAVEAVREGAPTLELRATLLARFRELFDLGIELRYRLQESESRADHARAAFELAERARARSLLDSLPVLAWRADEASLRLRGLAVELGAARDDLARLRDDLETTDAERLEAARRLDLAIAAYESARADWIASHPHEGDRLDRRPTTLAEMQEALGSSELFLEYHAGRRSSFLFVVASDHLELVNLGSTEDLARDIRRLGELLLRPSVRGAQRYRRVAFEVYRRAVEPALRDATVTRLYVSTDGPLWNLPFAALVRSSHGRSYEDLDYLGNEVVIRYLPSGAVGLELRERGSGPERPRASLVAFGDPAVPIARASEIEEEPVREARRVSLPPLPGARAEVRELGRLVTPSTVWMGEDATELRFRQLVDEPPTRIHLATHASVDRWRPDLSWVHLAPGDGHDGRLEAWEIATLPLPVDQVVLAACGSGLGRPVAGEGLIGLVQAFFDAGARSVVASLWPIADGSTSGLMLNFYRALEESGAATALAAAQRSRVSRGGLMAHPYYWASFVISGWAEGVGETTNR